MLTERPIIALAGAGGDLGARIAKALMARGVIVMALVRRDVADQERSRIAALGATLVAADPNDVAETVVASTGATCIISALNGLSDVIIDRQGVLLDADVRAAVPRVIPSDYAADFTKTRPGDNRNFDLRRAFMLHRQPQRRHRHGPAVCTAAKRHLPGMAGKAIYARPVQRWGATDALGYRAVSRSAVDLGSAHDGGPRGTRHRPGLTCGAVRFRNAKGCAGQIAGVSGPPVIQFPSRGSRQSGFPRPIPRRGSAAAS